jgi:hypothetical protein
VTVAAVRPGEPVAEPVATPDACVAYVNRVGLCVWQPLARFPGFPSLADAAPWQNRELINQTWFWKDDLHIEKRLFYGRILCGGAPAFVSLAFLPLLIAAQGDSDPRDLYEKGRLASNAYVVYQHIERHGPTATNALPWPPGSRHLYLAVLQRRFLITKHGLTGRTRGTYGYIWGRCDAFFPDAFTTAARIGVDDARARIVEHLNAQGASLTPAQAAKLFDWGADG